MFPQLKSRKFTDLNNGRVVSVTDQFENIAILDDGQRVDVKRLLDQNYFDEYIDPVNFFGDTYNVFAEKIKSVDLSQVKDEPENESAIIEVDPEQERREMEQRAIQMSRQMNPGLAAQKQVEMLKEILGDDEDLPIVNTEQNFVSNVDVSPNQLSIEDVQTEYAPVQQINHVQQTNQRQIEDPIISMFKNVKRNRDFSFTLDINDKIPRLDFIEMMEDSYETSIIDFLAEEFTRKLISDPESIKSKIIKEIKSLVYDNNIESLNDIPSQPLKVIGDNEPVDQINDGQSVVGNKRTRGRKKLTTNQND